MFSTLVRFIRKTFTGKYYDANGNIFINRTRPLRIRAIMPADPQDRALLAIAQNAKMNDTTLPSGLFIPKVPGKHWEVVGTAVYLMDGE